MSINSFNEKIDGTFAQVLDIQWDVDKGFGFHWRKIFTIKFYTCQAFPLVSHVHPTDSDFFNEPVFYGFKCIIDGLWVIDNPGRITIPPSEPFSWFDTSNQAQWRSFWVISCIRYFLWKSKYPDSWNLILCSISLWNVWSLWNGMAGLEWCSAW